MKKRDPSARALRKKEAHASEPPVRDGLGMMWQLTLDAYAAKGSSAAHAPLRRDIVRVIRRKPRRRRDR